MDATTAPFPQAAPLPQFKDRRAGLIVFGILEMLAGGICLLLVPLMILGQMMSAKATNGETNLRMILPAVFIYLIVAAVFIWLGIGSVKSRRWARALSLILGWSWLAIGVVMTIFYAVMLPKIFGAASPAGQSMPEATRMIATVVALVFIGFIFIIVPGAMVLFYGSRHVKATCEAHDTVVRWTDVRPLPVTGLCVWLWFGAAMMLMMPTYNCVIAFFGTLLSGWSGAVVCLMLAMAWVYAARALYQLRLVGWWTVIIVLAFFAVSNAITFARVDMMEMYRLMGYPEAQITQMERFNVFKDGGMAIWSVVWVLPVLGYLVYVKRFLAPSAANFQNSGGV